MDRSIGRSIRKNILDSSVKTVYVCMYIYMYVCEIIKENAEIRSLSDLDRLNKYQLRILFVAFSRLVRLMRNKFRMDRWS